MARTHGASGNQQANRTNPRASTKSRPELDYSVRYGSNYSAFSAKAWKQHEKLDSICVCCLKAEAAELHHSSYGGKPLNRLYDNLHPVCQKCHDQKCHGSKNWKRSKSNPVWGNKNTAKFTKRLQLGYKLLNEK